MTNKEIFLETAEKIGNRLCNTAEWDNNTCTWKVIVPDKNEARLRMSKKEIADGNVYQGTAGISLFLSELYKNTGNKKLLDAAAGALLYSYKEALKLPHNSYGFHSGRIGIAYSLFKMGEATKDQKYIDYAVEILRSPYENLISDSGIDVISGAGGAIPPLLIIYHALRQDWILELAIKLGDNLLIQSHKEIIGLSWGSSPVQVRNLCGYAHGSAGIAHALFELFAVTKDYRYLFSGEKAIEYENHFYNENTLNWPDFRYIEMGEYFFNGVLPELKTVLLEKKLKGYRYSYMNAWCHGAPGIGLSRIRAFEITGNKSYKMDAINAIEGTLSSLEANAHNYSLCHGLSGNCETLLDGSAVFNQPAWIEKAEDMLLRGIDIFENKNYPWPCGTLNAASDPSLLLGEAGIGYYLLRLYSNSTPSVLCITPKESSRESQTSNSKGYTLAQREYVSAYFQDTIDGFNNFNLTVELGNNISEAYKAISVFIKNSSEEIKNYLADLFLPDKFKYLLTLGLVDFSEEFKDSIIRKDKDEINWEESTFVLNNYHNVIERKYQWDKTNGNKETAFYPEENEHYILLYRENNKIYCKNITEFAGAILICLKTPSAIKDISNYLMEIIQSPVDVSSLTAKIKSQLIKLYEAGFITIYNNPNENIDTLNESPEENMSVTEYETLKIRKKIRQLKNIDKTIMSKSPEAYFRDIEMLRESLKLLYLEPFFSHHLFEYYNAVDPELKANAFYELLDELEISFSVLSDVKQVCL